MRCFALADCWISPAGYPVVFVCVLCRRLFTQWSRWRRYTFETKSGSFKEFLLWLFILIYSIFFFLSSLLFSLECSSSYSSFSYSYNTRILLLHWLVTSVTWLLLSLFWHSTASYSNPGCILIRSRWIFDSGEENDGSNTWRQTPLKWCGTVVEIPPPADFCLAPWPVRGWNGIVLPSALSGTRRIHPRDDTTRLPPPVSLSHAKHQ